ncbi:MAG TPA: lasso peptide biosynthesis B2 protein [Angustibacter sp.]|nr:lasso peptide biosynthesis B2 protein [Angustibacter sp.]
MPWREWPLLVEVTVVALVVEVGLRLSRLPTLARRLGVPLAAEPADAPARRAIRLDARAQREWRAVGRVMRHWRGDTGTCLRTALVGGFVLRRLGPRLRLGVAKVDGRVQAHAWLEIGDRTLDPVGASAFATLATTNQPADGEGER